MQVSCEWNNDVQVWWILSIIEDVVDDGVDVGDVDLTVTVHVADDGPTVPIGVGGAGVSTATAAVDDDVDDMINVGDVNHAVTIHIPKHIEDGIAMY